MSKLRDANNYLSFEGLKKPEITTAVGVSLAASILMGYHIYLRNSDQPSKYIKASKLPENVGWLDQQTFEVFSSLCDAIVPSYTVQECNTDNITKAFDQIHPRLKQMQETMSISAIEKTKTYLCAGAMEFGTHKHCAEALERTTTKAEKRKLFLVLKLLSTSLGSFLLTGYPAPFQCLPLRARERALQDMRDSCLEQKKNLFLTFKRLVAGVYLSYTERGTENPLWKDMEYFPKHAVKPLQAILNSPEHTDNLLLKSKVSYRSVVTELAGSVSVGDCVDRINIDAVVIGSGCGGGVVAFELVNAGFNVLILEKGGFFQTEDFARWRESEAFPHTFEKGGLCTTADGNIAVLAGSCVGGGSTVNWSASFRTPRHVLEEWYEMGLSQFNPDGGDFLESLDYAMRMKNVNTNNSYHDENSSACESKHFVVNENNRLLWKGAKNAGYVPEKIPRNVKDCVNCGHCTYGCSHKAKQSSWNALLEPIVLEQAKGLSDDGCGKQPKRGKLYIIPDCYVDRVVYSDGKPKIATGVVATASIYSEQLPSVGLDRTLVTTRKLAVHAKVVVVAAGSIHTPAVLLRSQFEHDLIGKYLTLHPVLGAGSHIPKTTGLSEGVSMGVVVKHPTICADVGNTDCERYDAERHPVAIETPPIHPAILGLLLPWKDGLVFKIGSLGWKNFGAFIGISRDRAHYCNRIDIDADGNPVIHYRIQDIDTPNLIAGLEANLRMLRAGGGKILFYAHSTAPWYVPTNPDNDDEEFEAYIRQMKKDGIKPLEMQVFSAHQMSSCRMAASPDVGPVSSHGELFECENLFVADGSVLPTSLGINPMITIDAIAHMISKSIVRKLRRITAVGIDPVL